MRPTRACKHCITHDNLSERDSYLWSYLIRTRSPAMLHNCASTRYWSLQASCSRLAEAASYRVTATSQPHKHSRNGHASPARRPPPSTTDKYQSFIVPQLASAARWLNRYLLSLCSPSLHTCEAGLCPDRQPVYSSSTNGSHSFVYYYVPNTQNSWLTSVIVCCPDT
jgi:hypothetical protein